jgi:hypothetical protein
MMTPNGAFAISSSRVLITTDFQDLHKTISHIPYSSSYICVKYQCRNQPRNVPRDEECGKSDKSLYCFRPSCEIPYFSFPYRHFHFPGSLYGTIAPTILRVRVLLPHPTLLFPCSIHRKQKKKGGFITSLNQYHVSTHIPRSSLVAPILVQLFGDSQHSSKFPHGYAESTQSQLFNLLRLRF